MLQIWFKLLIVSVCFLVSGVFHIDAVEKIRTYHNGKFTYLRINSTNDSITIFDTHNTEHHPVLSRSYFRGRFSIRRISDDYYILNGELPGKRCRENLVISQKETDSENIIVHFKLSNAKRKYHILAKSNDNDVLYHANCELGDSMTIELPVDADGYEFSILPENIDSFVTGIVLGFAHTIKYLNIPISDDCGSFFSSPKEIEVLLPFFHDSIFDEWCVSGDLIQIYNYVYRDEIIWHGQKYVPCENITEDYEK